MHNDPRPTYRPFRKTGVAGMICVVVHEGGATQTASHGQLDRTEAESAAQRLILAASQIRRKLHN